jgi:undecaprenyl-phosphate 4-deoxy-4-formamido-L-arabinose transferase
MGFGSVLLAMATSSYALYGKLINHVPVQGWTSLVIVISLFSGATLISLGVIAEYLAVTMGIAMGKPLYVISQKPTRPTIQK